MNGVMFVRSCDCNSVCWMMTRGDRTVEADFNNLCDWNSDVHRFKVTCSSGALCDISGC